MERKKASMRRFIQFETHNNSSRERANIQKAKRRREADRRRKNEKNQSKKIKIRFCADALWNRNGSGSAEGLGSEPALNYLCDTAR